MTDWDTLGGACGHNKAYGLSLFPYQRKLCIEDLLGRHALGMLGTTLALQVIMYGYSFQSCKTGEISHVAVSVAGQESCKQTYEYIHY